MLVDLGGWHIAVLFVVVALYVASLVMVWQSGRGIVEKVVWTALIVFIPLIGILGWQANFWFGFIATRLNRPRGTAS